jgi:integrase
MPTVNFYAKKAEGNPPRSLVYLQMRYQGEKLVYSTKFNIDPKDWDKKKQCVKARAKTTDDGSVNLNDLLKNLRDVCLAAYNKEMAGGIPSREALKAHLDGYMYRNVRKDDKARKDPAFFDLVDRFISGEIGDKKTEGTLKTYETAKMHLENFQEAKGYQVNFATINLEFKYAYVNFLGKSRMQPNKKTKKKVKVPALSANSIAKEIKNVRTFMNMAVELGYTTNLAFKSKKFGKVEGTGETAAVYLNDRELRDLYKYDFSNTKRLEAVRDLFVFSSFVGLRYSDASAIKPENIVKKANGKYRIKIIMQKTGDPVEIPCNDIVMSIFKKYEANSNRLPPSITNQKYNKYLQEVCELAGLTETGRLSSDLNKPLFECISSHTARRNFATNCYLAGMDSRMIMTVTGHKTEESFKKYIKVSREETADKMDRHMENNLSKEQLSAVG